MATGKKLKQRKKKMGGVSMADRIRTLLAAKGVVKTPCDPDTVPIDMRRAIARTVNGKLFDVNSALKSDHRFAKPDFMSPGFAAGIGRLEKELERAQKDARAEAIAAAKKAAVLAERERLRRQRDAKQPKFPSQLRPQFGVVDLPAELSWVRESAERWAREREQEIAFTIRRALQVELVDRGLKTIDFKQHADSGVNLPPCRLTEGYEHLAPAVEEACGRFREKYGKRVTKSDVIRTCVARFLRHEGYAPK
jgi:hypothetical protein